MITKHEGTGGLVSVGTVTAQLLYEIAGPAYLGPDATAHFDTVVLAQDVEHRVSISGVRGSPPPETLKVAFVAWTGAGRLVICTAVAVEGMVLAELSVLGTRAGRW